MAWLLRHRQTKGADTDRLGLRNAETCSLLYPITRKNVYEDVRELCEYGLLEKDERGTLRAPYDQLVIRADLHQARVA